MRSWFITFMLLLAVPALEAGELHLILSGKAIHLDPGDYNESNWGVGFEYDFTPRGHWIPFVAGASFLDSNEDVSNYLGGGTKYRRHLGGGWHLDGGIIGFVMTRKDYHDNSPFIGVLPFASLGTERVALNVTYVPRVQQKTSPLIYFQLMFRLAQYD